MKKILLYNSGGGLGDSIQLFSLIISLKKYFINTDFYYLGAHENHYNNSLKDYGVKIKNLDLNIRYFGFRWFHYFMAKRNFLKLKIEKFDLIIDLQSKIRNTVILNKIPNEYFYSSTFNYKYCTIQKNYFSSENLVENTISNLNIFLRTNIKKIDYDIKNLNEKFLIEAKRLLPNNGYIGFSITQGNIYRKKSWSIDNFVKLANKVQDNNKIPVFFIKKDDFKTIEIIKSKVKNALFPEQKSKISSPALVTALSARLEAAISIDNGIMHMISLAKIPMILLFGPTNSKKFAPKDKLVKILDTKQMFASEDINKISVSDVFNKVKPNFK